MKYALATTAILLSLVGCQVAWAQSGGNQDNQNAASGPNRDTLAPLDPERGGFTNGTSVIEPRHLEIETGYLYLRADHTHTNRLDDNSILRYGVKNNVEVRFGLPAYRLTRDNGHNDLGWDDAQAGIKWKFLEEAGSVPALSVTAGTTLPIGTRGTGEHFFQPQVALEASKDLGPAYTAEVALVYTDGDDGTSHYDQWSSGLFLARHLTSKLDVFGETYRLGPQGKGTPNTGFAGGGITYQFSRDTVYDFGIDNGIFRTNRENFYLSTGISHRF